MRDARNSVCASRTNIVCALLGQQHVPWVCYLYLGGGLSTIGIQTASLYLYGLYRGRSLYLYSYALSELLACASSSLISRAHLSLSALYRVLLSLAFALRVQVYDPICLHLSIHFMRMSSRLVSPPPPYISRQISQSLSLPSYHILTLLGLRI